MTLPGIEERWRLGRERGWERLGRLLKTLVEERMNKEQPGVMMGELESPRGEQCNPPAHSPTKCPLKTTLLSKTLWNWICLFSRYRTWLVESSAPA